MGGLAGRIKYLYEGDLTFKELKTILENISLSHLPLYEKVDGFNCYFSCRRGMPVMARNLTEARSGGLSIIELSNREFKGGKKVKKVFIEALKNFSKDFRLLDKKIFESDGNQVFYNFEIVDKNTNRLFEYDSNGLVLHNSGHFCIVENNKHFVNGDGFRTGTIGTKYIKHNFKTSLRENSYFDGSSFIQRIDEVMQSVGLSELNSISELKEQERLKKILNEFSNNLINSLKSNFVDSQEEKVTQFKDRVKEAVDCLLEYSGPNRAQVVEKTIHYLNQFPAIDSINSCIEGVVFEHNGEMYKMTGYYRPINQLYGFYQKTLKEFDSGRMYPIEPSSYNVDGVLTHPQEKTIAIFPGSFKPPHAGHYRIIEELKKLKTPDGFHICNKIIILISNKARMAQSDSKTTYVTAEIAKELWDLYVSNEDAQTRIEVRVADHDTPIKCVYDIMLNEMSPGETLMLVKSDKDANSDRFNAFSDFSDEYDLGVKVIAKEMNIFSAGISASNMRNWIADGDEDRFKGFLPDHLSSEDRARGWEIVTGEQDVSLSEDDSFFLSEGYDALLEGEGDKRLKSALRKNPDYKEQIEALAAADPSGKGRKLLPWMVRELVKFDGGRTNDIIAVISLFWQYRQRFKAASYSTDVFSYSFEEMLTLLKKLRLTPRFDKIKSPLRTSNYPGSSVVYEEEDFAVIRPYTFEASCYFGEEGNWCISTDEGHWNDYVGNESVHYILINDSIKFEEDADSKIDFVVRHGTVMELWDKENTSLDEDYVEELLGEELYNKIEQAILTDYERDPDNEETGNRKEWIELQSEIEADWDDRKYITCEIYEYDSNQFQLQAWINIDFDETNIKLKPQERSWQASQKFSHAIEAIIDYTIEDVEVDGNTIRGRIYLDDVFTPDDAQYSWEQLTEKDDYLQGDDPDDNIRAVVYSLWEYDLIEGETESKIEIIKKIDEHEFRYLFADFDEDEGLSVQFTLHDLMLPIFPEQYVVYEDKGVDSMRPNLSTQSFQNRAIRRQTFEGADIKMHTQDFFKKFGIPTSLVTASEHEVILGEKAYGIVNKNLEMETFAIRDNSGVENYRDVDEKVSSVVKQAGKDPDFLDGGIIVEYFSKDGKLVNSVHCLIKFYLWIGIADLLYIDDDDMAGLLEKLIELDSSGKIEDFRNQIKDLMLGKRKSIMQNDLGKIKDNIGRKFINKYYLSNFSVTESFTDQILEKCGPDKTVIVWNSPRSQNTDRYFLEAKLEAMNRGIDTSGLYYAPVNELFMTEHGLIEEEINGGSSDQFAVVPKMNTKAHWYFNNLKSENQLASHSLGQFHLLMENRVDFLQKTYREKIFNKLINSLSTLYMAEIDHLNWKWLGPHIVAAYNKVMEDPAVGKEFLSSIEEDDIERLKDQAFEFFIETDPSKKKKFSQWLIFKFIKDDERIEDIWSSAGDLELFEQLVERRIIIGVDINKLSLKELKEIVDEHEGQLSARQKAGKGNEKEQIIKNEMDVLFQEGEYVMALPKTQRASCLLGTETHWCTASRGDRNMFDMYYEDGPLIVFITPAGKWQLHIESKQFMDKNDSPIDLLPWIDSNEIFKEPFLKFLLDNEWDKKLDQTDIYSQYFSNSGMLRDLSIFIFQETLTEEKALDIIEKGSRPKNATHVDFGTKNSFGGEIKNKMLFDILWNSEHKKWWKLKRRWVRKLVEAYENGVVPVGQIRKDMVNNFINLMPPNDFKEIFMPTFISENYPTSREMFLKTIAIDALGLKIGFNTEKGAQNFLTILERIIKNEGESNLAWKSYQNSIEPKGWVLEMLKRPNLKEWYSQKFEELDYAQRTAVAFDMLKTGKKNNDQMSGSSNVEFVDDNSPITKFFIPRLKKGISGSKKYNDFPKLGGYLSQWEEINKLDPEITDIWVDTFLNAVENGKDSDSKERQMSWMYGNITDKHGNPIRYGPPQFKQLIEPLKKALGRDHD